MKVFISHKDVDSHYAGIVARVLRSNGVDFYLDVIDPQAASYGDDLADHLREELGKCTHLIAIVSQHTKDSWWVPWEIGISTEKDQPLCTFAGDTCTLPGYLTKWPYLRVEGDVEVWVRAARIALAEATKEFRTYGNRTRMKRRETKTFYREMRARLGQR